MLCLGSACSSDRGKVDFEPISAGTTNAGSSNGAGGSDVPTDAGGSAQMGATSGAGDGTSEPAGGTDASSEAGSSNGGTTSGGVASGAAGMAGGSAGNAGAGGVSHGGAGGASNCTQSLEVCDGVDNDCDKLVDEGQSCASGCFGATYAGHRYAFCNVAEGAALAQDRCQSMGMTLVTIESAAENEFVLGAMPDSSWIGASDSALEGRWEWLGSGDVFWDGGPLDGKFQSWLENQPNNNGEKGTDENCAIIISGSGRWNDLNCELSAYGAACEELTPTP